jgi:hypothetical protein
MPYSEKQLEKHRAALTRGERVDVTLTTHEEKQGTGFIQLLRLTPAEQRARGQRWLLTCLALAPVTAVCPPHFPWPIITVTVGLVGGYLRRGRAELVLGGEAKCPQCQAFQILDGGNAEFPMAHFCSECGERSLVRPVAR